VQVRRIGNLVVGRFGRAMELLRNFAQIDVTFNDVTQQLACKQPMCDTLCNHLELMSRNVEVIGCANCALRLKARKTMMMSQ